MTGLEPAQHYVLALAQQADGTGALQPLSAFVASPAGTAVVNAVGPIRQIVQPDAGTERRYLIIAPGTPTSLRPPVQVQERGPP